MLAPISTARPTLPPSGEDSSDDEPPSYLDIALSNHERVRQNFADRNRAAHANPVPSALLAAKPTGRAKINASSKLVPLDDPAQARLASVSVQQTKPSAPSQLNTDPGDANAPGDE